MSSEIVFSLLKVRWRCFFKRLDNQIENISEAIISSFALHNFFQLENEEFINQDGILDDLIRQETEETHQEEIKINQVEKLYEMP